MLIRARDAQSRKGEVEDILQYILCDEETAFVGGTSLALGLVVHVDVGSDEEDIGAAFAVLVAGDDGWEVKRWG